MKKALLVMLTAALLAGCNKENGKSVAAPPADPALVTPGQELLGQLKLADVSKQPVAETLRVAGQIGFDEQRLARIGATITGRVTDIDALLGQSVKKGDVLASLNSSELSSQQLAYLKARAQLELNRRNAERAKALFEADVIGAAELQRRESEHQISVAETRAAADQLQLLGVSPAAIERLGKQGAVNSVTPVVATLSGVVVERKLAQGQVVQPADALFVVADLSRLWAVAQVPEQQVSQVKEGQAVSIEVPALGHEKLVGKLIYVGQTIDPETRTVLVRTELDNRAGRLKPAMLASMLIEAKPVERLVVPASAVVRESDEDHVFVAEGDGVFRLLKVKLGVEQGGQRVVLSGLKGQEKIVVEGAFHLNNERNRKEMEGS
ncbi:efflux RND transporter periplasmic adaptor subunit [Quatrionicoccus australiensis]|uniref:efflux RND transporter periplasmic adaptor subunit n=1 Tax=Quatrionicoccus australiensis TaxID=138118 RepID=UPI001CF918DD|nr:efflux RND transporter periplasmic adaptor subunit [Quatrionicoccus australiensis]UCV15410.1 efflux RND transporter periplasmic adaptor subunit [Quatrionicoccus australiensis]